MIEGDEATIRGSYEKLAVAVQKTKEGNLDQVPSFIGNWRALYEEHGHWTEVAELPTGLPLPTRP